MANHKSAQKRHRQNLKRRERNVALRSRVRTTVKKARDSIASKAKDKDAQAVGAVKEVAKMVGKNILKKKTASRLISRIMRANSKKEQAVAPRASSGRSKSVAK